MAILVYRPCILFFLGLIHHKLIIETSIRSPCKDVEDSDFQSEPFCFVQRCNQREAKCQRLVGKHKFSETFFGCQFNQFTNLVKENPSKKHSTFNEKQQKQTLQHFFFATKGTTKLPFLETMFSFNCRTQRNQNLALKAHVLRPSKETFDPWESKGTPPCHPPKNYGPNKA